MIKIPNKPIVYCDVDDTLVLWNEKDVPDNLKTEVLLIKDSVGEIRVWKHKQHIEMLRQFHARGHTVVVWSAGGSDWAESVVKYLQIEDIVDIVIPKPTWFIDDIPSNAFMSECDRIWIDPRLETTSRIKKT